VRVFRGLPSLGNIPPGVYVSCRCLLSVAAGYVGSSRHMGQHRLSPVCRSGGRGLMECGMAPDKISERYDALIVWHGRPHQSIVDNISALQEEAAFCGYALSG
jgi:hypothetical protein